MLNSFLAPPGNNLWQLGMTTTSSNCCRILDSLGAQCCPDTSFPSTFLQTDKLERSVELFWHVYPAQSEQRNSQTPLSQTPPWRLHCSSQTAAFHTRDKSIISLFQENYLNVFPTVRTKQNQINPNLKFVSPCKPK